MNQLLSENKAIFNWSGGKDSALCLYKVLQKRDYDVMCLLTSVNAHYQRVSMHGVRLELMEQQAKSIGIPLVKMMVPEMPTMEEYEQEMRNMLSGFKNEGATASIFGDIFLEDLRKYREDKLKELDIKGVFPLWKLNTRDLIEEFIDLGFKTITTCVNEKFLNKSFAGRVIDRDFLKDLPANVDPCGENGEFHTFVFDGPIFKIPIPFETGEIVYRTYNKPKEEQKDKYDCDTNDDSPFNTGFWYCDLLPK